MEAALVTVTIFGLVFETISSYPGCAAQGDLKRQRFLPPVILGLQAFRTSSCQTKVRFSWLSSVSLRGWSVCSDFRLTSSSFHICCEFSSESGFQDDVMAPVKMTQRLRALATLAEDPYLIPSAHMVLSSRDLQGCMCNTDVLAVYAIILSSSSAKGVHTSPHSSFDCLAFFLSYNFSLLFFLDTPSSAREVEDQPLFPCLLEYQTFNLICEVSWLLHCSTHSLQ